MAQRLDAIFDKTRGLLILLLLAGTALFFTTAAYEQFVRPKMVWAHTLAILLVLLAGARALTGRRVHLSFHGINLLLLGFFLWNLLMWPLAASRSLAAERVEWLFIVLLISWSWQEWAGGNLKRIILAGWALACSAGLTAFWALYQDAAAKWADNLPPWLPQMPQAENKLGDWRGLITAGFGNTDHIAAFLAFCYLPTMLLMLLSRGRWKALILQVILWFSAAALIVCWSVGNNAALILAFAVLIFGIGHARRRYLWRKRKWRLIGWAAGCCLIVFWLVTNNPLNPHRPGIFKEAFSSERWIEGGPTRGVIWLNTLEMIRQNQLTGVGPGCFIYAYPRMRSGLMPNDPEWQKYQGAYTNAAHNTLLQAWAELGPLGALLLIALVVLAYRRLGQCMTSKSRASYWTAWGGAAALTAWCGSSIMTFPLQLPVSTILFFAVLPLGEMLKRSQSEAKGFAMPALVMQGDIGETVVYMRGMNRITGISGSFNLPVGPATGLFLLWLAFCATWMWMAWRPLASDVIYNQAHRARIIRDADKADALYQQALQIYPWHHDARSEYSDFLVQTKRYEAAVEQLEKVFRRLDSQELYLRRAAAYEGLGKKTAAMRDYVTFRLRTAGARGSQGIPGIQEGGQPSDGR